MLLLVKVKVMETKQNSYSLQSGGQEYPWGPVSAPLGPQYEIQQMVELR